MGKRPPWTSCFRQPSRPRRILRLLRHGSIHRKRRLTSLLIIGIATAVVVGSLRAWISLPSANVTATVAAILNIRCGSLAAKSTSERLWMSASFSSRSAASARKRRASFMAASLAVVLLHSSLLVCGGVTVAAKKDAGDRNRNIHLDFERNRTTDDGDIWLDCY